MADSVLVKALKDQQFLRLIPEKQSYKLEINMLSAWTLKL
jgi:hypothetical protein